MIQKMGELLTEIKVTLDLPSFEGLLEKLKSSTEDGLKLDFKGVGQEGVLVQWKADGFGYLTALPLNDKLLISFYRLELDSRLPVQKIIEADGLVLKSQGYHPDIEEWEQVPSFPPSSAETHWVAPNASYFVMGLTPWRMVHSLKRVLANCGLPYEEGPVFIQAKIGKQQELGGHPGLDPRYPYLPFVHIDLFELAIHISEPVQAPVDFLRDDQPSRCKDVGQQRGLTIKVQERAKVFKQLKDQHPDWTQDRVAIEASRELEENITGTTVKNVYRAMREAYPDQAEEWTWVRGDRAR